ncbi:MAG: putative nitrogen fixation protein NifT [Leptolyngbya sp. LCM1.Bin17]|nr:MAG: putative nitrogen fixation protein NifT [Leptolyngbya sp. LCM1.Bin17]
MKIMLRTNAAGKLLVYVAKKDLEEEVVSQATGENNTQILTLSNGWDLAIAGLSDPIKTPQTVDARKLN